jgi:RNA polymerase sigma-70 factor (ECF subfamily)
MTPLHFIPALAASVSAVSLIAQVRMAGGQHMADSTGLPSASPQATGADTAATREQTVESRLVERICAGEKELFYELVRPYERAVYVAAFSVLHNEHDAEEVAQEAVLKAFTHLGRFRGEAKFSTWIIQIAINEARMKLRKDRRHLYDSIDEQPESEEGDYKPRDFADWREIPSEALERTELRDALRTAIASLSPKYREVFMLRDVQNVSITETANILGITESSVKTRLLRARLQLRDALAPGIDGVWSLGEKSYRKVRPW